MFLFRSYETEKKVEDVKNSENYIIESIYIITLDGEPLTYRNNKLEVYKKIEEIKNTLKFNLVLGGNKVYDDCNYDGEFCKIYSISNNTILGGENLEHIIRWKKINNN